MLFGADGKDHPHSKTTNLIPIVPPPAELSIPLMDAKVELEPFFSTLKNNLAEWIDEKANSNPVDKTVKHLGLKTDKELSDLIGVSTKTLSGWKRNISPLGKSILDLVRENHDLKTEIDMLKNKESDNPELQEYRQLKSILKQMLQ